MKEITIGMAAVAGLLLWRFLYLAWPWREERLDPNLPESKSGRDGNQCGAVTPRPEKNVTAGKSTPEIYALRRILFGLGGAAAGYGLGLPWWAVLLSGAAGIFLPGLIRKAAVKRENRKMLPDIEHLYNLLHLQKEAGAFILDSVIDSYRVVTYWRLKKALIELAGAINSKESVRRATEEFAGKFDNPYLYTLADIVRHSVEDGNTDSMLRDVSEQIAGIQQAQYVMEEGRQEMESILWFTLLFVGIVGGILFMGVQAIQGSAGTLLY